VIFAEVALNIQTGVSWQYQVVVGLNGIEAIYVLAGFGLEFNIREEIVTQIYEQCVLPALYTSGQIVKAQSSILFLTRN